MATVWAVGFAGVRSNLRATIRLFNYSQRDVSDPPNGIHIEFGGS